MFIIKNARVHIGNGNVLDNHDILINDKVIEKIGENLSCDNLDIIDASGNEVFPGFIDPVSSYGSIDTHDIKDQDEISKPVTPEVKIKYAFNHSEIMYESLYKVGITSIGAAPGNRNVIGGEMAVYKTKGTNSKKMLVKEPVALKGSVINLVKDTYGKRKVFPMTKMGIFNALENFLRERKNKLEESLPLFITANSQSEINSLITIANKYNEKIVICGGFQADRCLEDIKKANISVIVGEQTNLTAKNYNNTDLYKIGALQRDDILVSFTLSSDYGPEGKVKYLWNAIEFYKSGLDCEEVVKMMTINPAKMLGIDDRLGSIEEGKEADIVIYTNNPIKYYNSKVTHTIIGGKLIYEDGKVK